MSPFTTPSWEDRRDSPRVPAQMWVRSYDQDHFAACEGDVSLGGARIQFLTAPSDTQVEVLMDLDQRKVRLQGEILSMGPATNGLQEARVRFLEGDLMDELALARMLHAASLDLASWEQITRP
jgi:hypothetical protein